MKPLTVVRAAVVYALCLWAMSLAASTAEQTDEQKAISKMRGYYESFFTSRYSLEQEFPFRLVSIREQMVEYQPNTDVLSDMLGLSVDRHLQNLDAEKIRGTLVNALTPILYTLTTANPDAIDFLAIASQITGKALNDLLSIRSDVNKILTQSQRKEINYRLYLAPYRKTDARLVYNEHKINMTRYGQVSLFNDQREKSQSTIAQEIDLQRAHIYYQHDYKKRTAPSLLAVGMHFTFGKDVATLDCEILLHLYPRSFPYKETVDSITFREMVIPTGDDFRHPVALLKMNVPIYQAGKPQEPTLTMQFGNFAGIKDHQFVISEQKNSKFTPYLLGSVSKFKPLDIKFQFRTVLLSLKTFQAETVNMVFRPIFKIGSLTQANLGGYTIKKVDEEFKTSINDSLSEAKDKAIDSLTAEAKKEMSAALAETAKNKEVSELIKEGVMFGLEKLLAKADEKLASPHNTSINTNDAN